MLPPACVLLPSRQFRVLATCCPLRRAAPLSHCRVGSAGGAGIWQLCDAVRTVGCRSRFVLLAQQAIPAMQLLGATRTIWSAVDARPTRPRKARVDAWKRGRMTAFFTLWKLAALRRAAPRRRSRVYELVYAVNFTVTAASMQKVLCAHSKASITRRSMPLP